MVWSVLKTVILYSNNKIPQIYQLYTFSLFFIAVEMEREGGLDLSGKGKEMGSGEVGK